MNWLWAGAILCFYNSYVCVKLFSFGGYSKQQKIIQFLIVWILPLLGAYLVHSVIKSTMTSSKAADRNFIPNDDSNKTIG